MEKRFELKTHKHAYTNTPTIKEILSNDVISCSCGSLLWAGEDTCRNNFDLITAAANFARSYDSSAITIEFSGLYENLPINEKFRARIETKDGIYNQRWNYPSLIKKFA